MALIARTFDREIVGQDGIFEIRKRPMAVFIVAGISFLAAALFYALGSALASDKAAIGLFLKGAGGLLGAIGLLGLMGAVVVASVRPLRSYAVLDRFQGTLTIQKQTIPLDDLTAFQVMPFGPRFVGLMAVKRSGETFLLWTVVASQLASLLPLADRFNALLHSKGSLTHPLQAEPSPSLESQREQLKGAILLFMGVLWTTAGYFFFSGLYFVNRLQADGLRVPAWSLGTVFMAMGVIYLWKGRRS